VHELKTLRGYSERRACPLIGCSRSTIRYCVKRSDDRLLTFLLRRDHALIVNHKRFFRGIEPLLFKSPNEKSAIRDKSD
jgi:hypothetical protein